VTATLSSILLISAAATAAFHTLIPDHWLPFVLVGRARGWGARTTAFVSAFSALVHAALSAALGALALVLGEGAARTVGVRIEHASGILLVVFGAAYGAWAWRKGGHFHPGGRHLHAHDPSAECDGHEGPGNPEHLHYHDDVAWIRAGKGGMALALIVGLNPCVLILPIMVAALPQGPLAVVSVTAVYSATTVLLMVGLSVVGVVGAHRIPVPPVARYMEAASGALIAIVGLVLLALGR
jgi:nickel/cobalt exporter